VRHPASRSVVESHTDHGVEVLVVLPAEVYKAETIEFLRREVRLAVEASERTGFVLDLGRVTFLTSAALGLLINLQAHLRERACRLVVAGAVGEVAGVLAQARLGAVLPVYPTVAEAVAALGDSAASSGACDV